MSKCIFCMIASGEMPCYKIWEDEEYIAFLDIFPIKPGHALLIPKKHIPYIFDFNDQELSNIMLKAKFIAEKLKKSLNPKTGKIGIVVYGLDIDHTHIHLVPLNKPGDLNFANKRPSSKEQLQKILNKITHID